MIPWWTAVLIGLGACVLGVGVTILVANVAVARATDLTNRAVRVLARVWCTLGDEHLHEQARDLHFAFDDEFEGDDLYHTLHETFHDEANLMTAEIERQKKAVH